MHNTDIQCLMGFHYRCKICSFQNPCLFPCCKSCFYFLTFPARTRPLPRSHNRRAIARLVVGSRASNCSPHSLSPNSETCRASTTHCTHIKVSKPSDKMKKESLLHSLAMAAGDSMAVYSGRLTELQSCLIDQSYTYLGHIQSWN